MIKYLLLLISLIGISNANDFISWRVYNVQVPEINYDLTTNKVAHITGHINETGFDLFEREFMGTTALQGDRLIVIDSTGGLVFYAERMLKLIKKEQSRGVKIVCFVTGKASSMAFNILSKCDLRISSLSSRFLFHKISIASISETDDYRLTPNNLRRKADELEKDDEPYRKYNAKLLHMSLRDYDMHAENETRWTAPRLLQMKYLDYIGVLN